MKEWYRISTEKWKLLFKNQDRNSETEIYNAYKEKHTLWTLIAD
jgi:hypothetical protein